LNFGEQEMATLRLDSASDDKAPRPGAEFLGKAVLIDVGFTGPVIGLFFAGLKNTTT